MTDLVIWEWLLLGLAAVVVGISKTALPGAATVAVVLFAVVLPARQSTAVLLILFIVGDVIALISYRRHANWPVLLRLVPAVLLGVVAGAVFLAVADDSWVRRVIGVILLIVVAFTLWRRRLAGGRSAEFERPHPAATLGYGSMGGFTTMVANAGGPVMSMYFLAARFPVNAFLGTAAWFFAVVNLVKLPFAVGLGLVTPEGLVIDAVLAPVVLVAALAGRLLVRRMSQTLFESIVIVLTIAGALYLLI